MGSDREFWRRVMSAGSCPSIEKLVGALEKSEDDMERKAARKHLKSCPSCRAEFDTWRGFVVARELPQEKKDVDWIVRRLKSRSLRPIAGEPSRSSFRTWFSSLRPGYWIPVAAGLVLALLVVGRFPADLGPVPETINGTALRSGSMTALEPVGTLADLPHTFSWQPVDGAEYYVVKVFEVDRAEIWTGRTTEGAVEIPREIHELAEPGKTLLWQVSAYDKSGNLLARSDRLVFRRDVVPEK